MLSGVTEKHKTIANFLKTFADRNVGLGVILAVVRALSSGAGLRGKIIAFF